MQFDSIKLRIEWTSVGEVSSLLRTRYCLRQCNEDSDAQGLVYVEQELMVEDRQRVSVIVLKGFSLGQ